MWLAGGKILGHTIFTISKQKVNKTGLLQNIFYVISKTTDFTKE